MNDQKLAAAATLILSSLAEGDRHGYAIRKAVAQRTEDAIRLGVTTLYRHLKQLQEAGLIDESPARPAPELDDERRRYFRITAAGRRALAAEIKRMQRVLAAAQTPARARGRS